MIEIQEPKIASSEWYAIPGSDSDVCLSTKVRLARNLSGFPFPGSFLYDDALHVQSLIFDAFLKDEDPDSFQIMNAENIPPSSASLLIERGLINSSLQGTRGGGVIMRIKGEKSDSGLSITINDGEHIVISALTAGFDCGGAFKKCREIDSLLQKSLRFSYDDKFGYYTANISDSGSGMRLSAKVHLPSAIFMNRELPPDAVVRNMLPPGFSAENLFSKPDYPNNFFIIRTCVSGGGTETEQLATFSGVIKKICETERRFTDEVLKNRKTETMDVILKNYSKAKFSFLLDLGEAMQIISALKWGKNLALIDGIKDEQLTALQYRVQECHLREIAKKSYFSFSPDIASDEKLKAARLRAFIVQDIIEKIKFV